MHLRVDQYLSIALLTLVILISGVSPNASAAQSPGMVSLLSKPEIVIPVIDQQVPTPALSAVAAIVIDEASAVTLYEHNAQQQFSPASTTKLLTALLARQLYQLDTALTVPQVVGALDGTTMGLVPGEKISVHALLKGALIQSGNDAAVTLAQAHPQGIDGFVLQMNALTQQLAIRNSHFENPVGYDAPDHYSTPQDLALLAREVMKDPVLRQIVGTARERVTDTTGGIGHDLVSTHKLLGLDPSVIGIKTGTTEEAGEVLITQFKLNDQSILIVVMGSKDRYSDTRALMEYIRQAVVWQTITVESATAASSIVTPLDMHTAQ